VCSLDRYTFINLTNSPSSFRPFSALDADDICAKVCVGGDVSSGGFAARAQGAGDRNANAGGNAGEKKCYAELRIDWWSSVIG
jgi:hypothetical protein